MAADLDPIVGDWYRYLGKGQMFKVVEVDAVRGVIEIQHFDGDLDELEASEWADLELEAVEEPEDWTGPIDVETEDLDYGETGMSAADWRASIQDVGGGTDGVWEEPVPEPDPEAEPEPEPEIDADDEEDRPEDP